MSAVASTSGRLGDLTCFTPMCGMRLLRGTQLAPAWRTGREQRVAAARPLAALGQSKNYNKYKTRQDLERDYYKEWEKTTKLTEEEKSRPMTLLTLLAFLPTWFKFYVIPGPIRFVWFFVWMAMKRAGYQLRKRAVIVGAKLDVSTLQRRGGVLGYRLRETALLRLHGKQSILAPLKLMLGR